MNKPMKTLSDALARLQQAENAYNQAKENAARSEQIAYSVAVENLSKVADATFDADSELQSALKGIEASEQYGLDELGIYAWYRYVPPKEYLSDDVKPHFDAYIEAYGYRFDSDNDALINSFGSYIGVDYQGNVYLDEGDGGPIEMIATIADYTTEDGEVDEDHRNTLIEEWMESKGYYPGVFSIDYYHGNVFPIKTKS